MLSEYQTTGAKRMLSALGFAGTFIIGPLALAFAGQGTFAIDQAKEIDTKSLDANIQKIAEVEIKAAVLRHKAKSGVVAVADPATGRVLAFAEFRSDVKSESWARRVFAPGSTIKPFVVAAALDAGVATESQVYDCRQPYDVGGTKFNNHNDEFTDLSVTDAVVKSVNVCVIKLAQDLGSLRLRETLSRFGIDVASQWRSDSSDALQTATTALGETVPVTVSSLMGAYGVLANRGRQRKADSDAAVSESTSDAVRRMLVATVKRGTGTKANIPSVDVAGKTGTIFGGTNARTQISESTAALGLFAGFAPAENPRFVALVVIEDGYRVNVHEKAGGGVLAAPVFHAVVERSLALKADK